MHFEEILGGNEDVRTYVRTHTHFCMW